MNKQQNINERETNNKNKKLYYDAGSADHVRQVISFIGKVVDGYWVLIA